MISSLVGPRRRVRLAALAAVLAWPVVAATACEGDGTFGLTGRAEDPAIVEFWQALEVDGLKPDTVPGIRGGRFRYVRLRDTVRVGWYVGCNFVGVRFLPRRDSLRLIDALTTRIGCSDRMLALDDRIFGALSGSIRYTRRDSTVKFLDANGSTRIRFRVLPDTTQPYGMSPEVGAAP
jgi:heat shock protein HslJ